MNYRVVMLRVFSALLLCCFPLAASAQPGILRCWSRVAVGRSIRLPAKGTFTAASGDSLIVWYAGQGSDPHDISDSANDRFVSPDCSASQPITVTSASSGYVNMEVSYTPARGADYVTVPSLGPGVNNFGTACLVSNLGSIPDCGGDSPAPGTDAFTGSVTTDRPGETIFGHLSIMGTNPVWTTVWSDYLGNQIPGGLPGAGASNGSLLVGGAKQISSQNETVEFQRFVGGQ